MTDLRDALRVVLLPDRLRLSDLPSAVRRELVVEPLEGERGQLARLRQLVERLQR